MKNYHPPLNLAPAHWIWAPMERCLPNTFVLFRREFSLAEKPDAALGHLTADSRYRLTVNGQYIQRGPAPCDPRHQEADPIALAAVLVAGKNVIAVEVCYFGQGDGTWPMGAPGFLLRLDIEHGDGTRQQILSDDAWLTRVDRAHPPGTHKRWFLRALQEIFDARLHPQGWEQADYEPDAEWLPAHILPGSPDKPSIFAGGPEVFLASDDPAAHTAKGFVSNDHTGLCERRIPALDETVIVEARACSERGFVQWHRHPDDWFQMRVPGSLTATRDPSAAVEQNGAWHMERREDRGVFLTFEFPEHLTGYPMLEIEAPEGTQLEIMVQESHDPENGPAWLDSYIYHWSRFICREGVNHFETFDYESFRWLQVHVHPGAPGIVKIRNVACRRRLYPWKQVPDIRCSEPALQRLFDASINTVRNSCGDNIQDGAGRERQQYSGDGGHQVHAVRMAFGEYDLPSRYIATFSQGLTLDGFFMDCWPAYDRLARLMQRQIGTTVWGPLLDHGVGFGFDCYHHYLESGQTEAVTEAYPRLLRFRDYLMGLRDEAGLAKCLNIGVPTVWLDHDAYRDQRHKQCAFNLYIAAMLRHALAPLCDALGTAEDASVCRRHSEELVEATVKRFWDPERKIFVINRPWLVTEAEGPLLCDRSLATAVLYDFCPQGETEAAVAALVDVPRNMGLSYPCNAGWRLWALGKAGRADVIVDDFRSRWATMASVIESNSLQENWTVKKDSHFQWSHCPLSPLFVLIHSIAGITPTSPGFETCTIRPQLGDLADLHLTVHTPKGPIQFDADAETIRIRVPAGVEATLILPGAEPILIDGQVEVKR